MMRSGLDVEIQPSLGDALGRLSCPWDESHGYRRLLATRVFFFGFYLVALTGALYRVGA